MSDTNTNVILIYEYRCDTNIKKQISDANANVIYQTKMSTADANVV